MGPAAMLVNYSFAYQPIVDVQRRAVQSFEALVRGPDNQPASWVFDQLKPSELGQFDLDARLFAVELATQLELPCRLSLNLLPQSLAQAGSAALRSTVEMAGCHGLPANQLELELSERDSILSMNHFISQIDEFRAQGVRFSIDDFGAGYSGLNLLAEFQPDQIKLDIALVRDIATHGPRQAIVRGVLRTCGDLGIDVVAEGVETLDEYQWLRDEGVGLFQGYLFARPAFRRLPEVLYPTP